MIAILCGVCFVIYGLGGVFEGSGNAPLAGAVLILFGLAQCGAGYDELRWQPRHGGHFM